ncbi:MAG TPA: hypothetical protein VFK32_01735 [Tepidiformaceae bacterium]|nr:hypothetical protein [Tepidiformaceae bacterium]
MRARAAPTEAARRDTSVTAGSANGAGPATEPAHSHHWILEEASGPVSRGSCRECHAERDFQNWLPELDFVTRAERNTA